MKRIITALFGAACLTVVEAQTFQPAIWGDWQTWGEQPDAGEYVNPVLPADFSDIDCIEHDDIYYAISSTMQYEPGMAILRSTDMVHWELCSHAVNDLSQISRNMTSEVMDRYGRGIWAGAIRWHGGRFHVYFGCPMRGCSSPRRNRLKGPGAIS